MACQPLCFLYNSLLFIVLARYDIFFNKVIKDINFILFYSLVDRDQTYRSRL